MNKTEFTLMQRHKQDISLFYEVSKKPGVKVVDLNLADFPSASSSHASLDIFLCGYNF